MEHSWIYKQEIQEMFGQQQQVHQQNQQKLQIYQPLKFGLN